MEEIKFLKMVTRYECPYCKKVFKTPDRHYCKKNPELRNCFTCKHLRDWFKGDYPEPNYPDCAAGEDGWNIEDIKSCNYNMQCSLWEEGEYIPVFEMPKMNY